MKKILFIILLLSLKSYSQVVEYQVSMIGTPQKIFLQKDTNQNYKGYILTEFYKPEKRFLGITLRKYKDVEIKTNLDEIIVKKTIEDLNKSGIENIEKCETDADCDSTSFLDGDYLSFKIKNGNSTENYEFSEVYPENLERSNIEKNKVRRKAQIFITIIDKNLDLKKQFRQASKEIKRPYCYNCGGISSCCIK